MRDCHAWNFKKEKGLMRITKGRSNRMSATGLSPAPVQALLKQKEPTAGNWTGCFKSVQKRTNKTKSTSCVTEGQDGIQTERMAREQTWSENRLQLFCHSFKTITYNWLIGQILQGYIWIRRSRSDLLRASVTKSRCSPMFQPLITLIAHREQERLRRSTTKNGLWWIRTRTDIFIRPYPEYVNKCVKVFFQRCSLHW